jgi:hypothetical protein
MAPSDFLLFSHFEQLLKGYEFSGRGALLREIEDILRGIENVILEDVFLSEMERLRQCGSAAAEYVEETKFLCEENCSALVSSWDAHGLIIHPGHDSSTTLAESVWRSMALQQ